MIKTFDLNFVLKKTKVLANHTAIYHLNHNNSFSNGLYLFKNHEVVLNLNVGSINYLPRFNNNQNLNLFDNTQMWIDYVAIDKQTL